MFYTDNEFNELLISKAQIDDQKLTPKQRTELNEFRCIVDQDYPVPEILEEEKTRELLISEMGEYQGIVNEYDKEPTHKLVIKRLKKAGAPYYSNSNISEYISDLEREELINEAQEAFSKVMDTLVIDCENDPNSKDTPRRLAKMYINELMRGRYYPAPAATSFPNIHTGKTTGFGGLLVVRVELTSMCSHHHQIVNGVAYIGIIPKDEVIGLSKYTRLAQWVARRGTLQEELAEDIVSVIQKYTGSDDIGLYLEAQHGCCTHRGIGAHDSTTQTTVLRGEFLTDGTLRKEFHDNVMYQKLNK